MIYKDDENRYLTKQLLIEFNNASIREKRSNNLKPEFLESLPEANYPIKFCMFHTRDEVRVYVVGDGYILGLLDMSVDRYNLIPNALKNKDGSLELKTESEIRTELPYGGKEWTEKVYKKPYRAQASFRKIVLNAYDNKCAICGESNNALLRAAHIKDAACGGTEDIKNGICLCANHEIAFDKGLLIIHPNGAIQLNMEDPTVRADCITFPNDPDKYPSEELLKWKYNKVNCK